MDNYHRPGEMLISYYTGRRKKGPKTARSQSEVKTHIASMCRRPDLPYRFTDSKRKATVILIPDEGVERSTWFKETIRKGVPVLKVSDFIDYYLRVPPQPWQSDRAPSQDERKAARAYHAARFDEPIMGDIPLFVQQYLPGYSEKVPKMLTVNSNNPSDAINFHEGIGRGNPPKKVTGFQNVDFGFEDMLHAKFVPLTTDFKFVDDQIYIIVSSPDFTVTRVAKKDENNKAIRGTMRTDGYTVDEFYVANVDRFIAKYNDPGSAVKQEEIKPLVSNGCNEGWTIFDWAFYFLTSDKDKSNLTIQVPRDWSQRVGMNTGDLWTNNLPKLNGFVGTVMKDRRKTGMPNLLLWGDKPILSKEIMAFLQQFHHSNHEVMFYIALEYCLQKKEFRDCVQEWITRQNTNMQKDEQLEKVVNNMRELLNRTDPSIKAAQGSGAAVTATSKTTQSAAAASTLGAQTSSNTLSNNAAAVASTTPAAGTPSSAPSNSSSGQTTNSTLGTLTSVVQHAIGLGGFGLH